MFEGHDLCEGLLMLDERKGDTMWPDTLIGSRRAVVCPYSVDTPPLYTSSECLYCNWSAHWSQFNIDHCPDPPFTLAVQALNDYINQASGNDDKM